METPWNPPNKFTSQKRVSVSFWCFTSCILYTFTGFAQIRLQRTQTLPFSSLGSSSSLQGHPAWRSWKMILSSDVYMGGSWLAGTLKWLVYKGKSHSNGWWLGVPLFQETSISGCCGRFVWRKHGVSDRFFLCQYGVSKVIEPSSVEELDHDWFEWILFMWLVCVNATRQQQVLPRKLEWIADLLWLVQNSNRTRHVYIAFTLVVSVGQCSLYRFPILFKLQQLFEILFQFNPLPIFV